MLQTAERPSPSATDISRERQDEYGARQPAKGPAGRALRQASFGDEIVPIKVVMGIADKETAAHDDERGHRLRR